MVFLCGALATVSEILGSCSYRHERKVLEVFAISFQTFFSCNVVIHYGNKLWLTYSKDVSLETLRVLICSKEAFTLFEAQIQWENRFPGACYVQVQGASLSS